MVVKILDALGQFVQLSDPQASFILEGFSGTLDPRVSSCVTCNSSVIATEPFNTLLDELSNVRTDQSDLITQLVDLVENSESVHLYVWEDNSCVHVLWRDPLASEWSTVTGEQRLHH